MPRRLKVFLPLSLFAIGVFFGLKPVWSFDLWWQMAEARWIVDQGAWPTTDHFTYSLGGAPYVAHEWGSDMVFYALYTMGGGRALLSFQALAFGLFGVGAYILLLRRKKEPWLAWGFALALLFIAKLRFPLRPELFTHFFMLALWFLDARKARRAWLGYLVLFGLWANFHGEFVLGLGFVALSAAAFRTRDWGCRLAASIAGVLFNPYGWKLLSVPWFYLRHQEAIFRASTEGQFVPTHCLIALVLAVAASALLYRNHMHGRRPRTPWRELAVVVLFGLQTFKINRIFLLYALVVLPILYDEALSLVKPRLKKPGRAEIFAYALVLLIVLPRLPLAAAAWRKPMDERSLPVRAVDFLDAIGARGRVFNSYSFGGYLTWRLHPRIRTFYDGRFHCTQLIYDENAARVSPRAWREFLDRHDASFAVMDWVWEGGLNAILHNAWKKRPGASPYALMFPRRDWALIYWDDRALVLARDVPKNRAVIRKYGLHFGDPLSIESTLAKAAAGRLSRAKWSRELDAVRERSGDNWVQGLIRRRLAAQKLSM